MKILVTGHSLVIDANRSFWNIFARTTGSIVDLIAPAVWSSNLSSHIPLQKNPKYDSHLRSLLPLPVFFRGNGSLFFFSPFQLWRQLNREKYDVLYLNQETWSLATLTYIICRQFSKNRKSKLFLCVAQNLKKEKYKFLHPYERLISRFITSFLHCSQEVEDVLRWKGIETPSFYFPLPFDEETYHVGPRTTSTLTLGYLGRLSEDKGIHLLLQALDELNKDQIVYPLITAGKGPLESELLSRKYVSHLGLIPHNQAHTFYQKIDLFILPSQTRPHWKEQFGRVITEAFASGRPVLGSTSGSIPEVLGKVNWPWLFEETSSEDLVLKIKSLDAYLSTAEGQAHLQQSVATNQNLFSQKAVAEDLQRVFQGRPRPST